MHRLNIAEENLVGFVWADDCSIDVRYFAMIYIPMDEQVIKFTFGCDLGSFRSPSWTKEFILVLQKAARKKDKKQLAVHEDVFQPFFNCFALFDEHSQLRAVQINIQTSTSKAQQTVPLPIQHLFEESQSF